VDKYCCLEDVAKFLLGNKSTLEEKYVYIDYGDFEPMREDFIMSDLKKEITTVFDLNPEELLTIDSDYVKGVLGNNFFKLGEKNG